MYHLHGISSRGHAIIYCKVSCGLTFKLIESFALMNRALCVCICRISSCEWGSWVKGSVLCNSSVCCCLAVPRPRQPAPLPVVREGLLLSVGCYHTRNVLAGLLGGKCSPCFSLRFLIMNEIGHLFLVCQPFVCLLCELPVGVLCFPWDCPVYFLALSLQFVYILPLFSAFPFPWFS